MTLPQPPQIDRQSKPFVIRNIVIGAAFIAAGAIGKEFGEWSQARRQTQQDARVFVDSLVSQMSRRNFAMQQVVWAISNGNARPEQMVRWARYRDGELQRWNENISVNSRNLCTFFGVRVESDFQAIAGDFRTMHNDLLRHFRAPYAKPEEIDSVRRLAQAQEKRIEQFVKEVARRLRDLDEEYRPC